MYGNPASKAWSSPSQLGHMGRTDVVVDHIHRLFEITTRHHSQKSMRVPIAGHPHRQTFTILRPVVVDEPTPRSSSSQRAHLFAATCAPKTGAMVYVSWTVQALESHLALESLFTAGRRRP